MTAELDAIAAERRRLPMVKPHGDRGWSSTSRIENDSKQAADFSVRIAESKNENATRG